MAPIRKVLAVCMALLAGMTAFGQSPEGAIVGTVVDSSGAAVAGARVSVVASQIAQRRSVSANRLGEFKLESLPPGTYQVRVEARSFASVQMDVAVAVSSRPTLRIVLKPAATQQSLTVQGTAASMAAQPLETTSSVVKTTVSAADLREIPLAHRSFANIAYLAPMTEPVEPSDPTKARITAVSFGGSSGLNVDLSVDGGDNNDDFIGGFLQNYSPDAMQEFTVRTAQFDADTSRTNGGSVIITTRHGTNDWHGDVSGYYRNRSLNARNPLDNPVPEPKQPFARGNGTASVGGPLVKDRIWFFSSFEYVHEDSSVGYSGLSLSEFNALSQLAAGGRIPGVQSIAVPSSVGTPFRDSLASTRLDFAQSERSHWFVRGAFDLNRAENDLVHQGALPSTGFTTTSHYFSLLVNHQLEMTPEWIGSLTLQASGFHHEKVRNSNVGFALAFPFSASFHTTSGFETFGDNQFVTPITAFPVNRDQQKYQFRYDLAHAKAEHSYKIGVNLIHEPVLSGRLSDNGEILHVLPENPSFYVVNPGNFATDFNNRANQVEACASTSPPGQCLAPNDGRFAQSVRRLGLYLQDSWRLRSNLALNYGLRYDTTFGLFNSNGGNQNQNSAVLTVASQNLALPTGVPHDYRKAIAPRLGLAWSPRGSGTTVVRAGAGMYYNDLTQSGWVDALRAVSRGAAPQLLMAGEQGAIIDPNYHSPYAFQTSAGVEHDFDKHWRLNVSYQHQQGVHQYRRYEYAAQNPVSAPNATLPVTAPNISVFRSDNRSRYDGVSFAVIHSFSSRFEMTAHYTLASASTWGATAGELFDYVNGVSNVSNPFGPGDHGPSGEDVRHRFVIAGTLHLPWKFEAGTLSQFESGRPFTLTTGTDINRDGVANDRAVVNGRQTTLDQFRGVPFAQVDLRISREFKVNERASVKPFVEFFNLLNRQNPGNNFVGDIAALPVPASEVEAGNVTHLCLNSDCSALGAIRNPSELRMPAGALGDFFGPGTTVGIPFAAQMGIRISF